MPTAAKKRGKNKKKKNKSKKNHSQSLRHNYGKRKTDFGENPKHAHEPKYEVATSMLITETERLIVKRTAYGHHLPQRPLSLSALGLDSKATAALALLKQQPSQSSNVRKTYIANSIDNIYRMLAQLGHSLPQDDLDLTLRVEDIYECLHQCFSGFRLHTLLRSLDQFLAGNIRLPRLSRLIAIHSNGSMEDIDIDLLLGDACVCQILDPKTAHARVVMSLPRHRYKDVNRRNTNIKDLLNSAADLSFATNVESLSAPYDIARPTKPTSVGRFYSSAAGTMSPLESYAVGGGWIWSTRDRSTECAKGRQPFARTFESGRRSWVSHSENYPRY